MEVIGDILRGSEVHLMWESIGTFVDMSAEKASEQTTNIILTPGNTRPRVSREGPSDDGLR